MSRTMWYAQTARVARRVADILIIAADWVGDRLEDAAGWAAGLIRYLPRRIGRLVMTLLLAVVGLMVLLPVGIRVWREGGRRHFAAWLRARARQGAMRTVQLVLEVLDLLGMPELFGFIWRLTTRVSPLTGAEIAAAATVLGPTALRYHDIRVAQGGLLDLIFRWNGDRAFVTFHTVNLPSRGDHRRENLDILLHELVHVLQYERAGSRYFAEALLAQHEEGYGYGGPGGLLLAWARGKRLRDFNREQQAQIVQDYYMHLRHGWDTGAFLPYIEELHAGEI
ncbi:MAG: hypothetical protein ACUVR4_06255 [Anaerolineae bacterium]